MLNKIDLDCETGEILSFFLILKVNLKTGKNDSLTLLMSNYQETSIKLKDMI